MGDHCRADGRGHARQLPCGLTLASDIRTEEAAEAGSRYNQNSAVPLRLRRQAEFTRFFDGLELTGPGIVPVNRWQPDPPPDGQQEEKEALPAYAALGRKPGTSQ